MWLPTVIEEILAEAELRVSQIETSVAGRYNIPRPFPSTSVYSLFGSYGDVSPTWSSTRVGRVGASWSHMRGPFREEDVRAQLDWLAERGHRTAPCRFLPAARDSDRLPGRSSHHPPGPADFYSHQGW